MTAFATFVASNLRSERFTLVDVGCSGGLESVWRLFADRFRAVGIDASAEECRRLAAEEKHPDVHYVAAFAGIDPAHPLAAIADGVPVTRDIYPRTSASWMMELRRQKLQDAPLQERLQHNAWQLTGLADPATPIIVPDLLERMGFSDVDLLKVDIDILDFMVLNSFDGRFDAMGLLAARLEVNLFGGPGDMINTFNNTDRFMRTRGFDLIALDTRNYSMRAPPARFEITTPAQTRSGRIFQGDAFYVRDLASPESADIAAKVSDEKLAKLAVIFSIWNQPDGAAELLLAFRNRLSAIFDVDAALDLLAAQAQPGNEQPLSYRNYMARFEADSADFYPRPWTPPPPITLKRRIAAALRAFRDPNKPPNV
jgi:hypothetical protein